MLTLKKVFLASSLALCMSTVSFAQALQSDLDKESYSMGAGAAKYILGQIAGQQKLGGQVNLDMVALGFKEALNNKSQLTSEQVVDLLNKRAEAMNKLEEAAKAKLAEANAAAAKAYLAKNAKSKGVKVTKSGLQYEVLAEGKGDKPRTEDVVTVDYIGKFIDGKVFESTYENKEPATFVMMTVIPGLEEGIRMMSPGAHYRFTIPADLAWGKEGAGQIQPESAVVFEVKLVKVDKVKAHSGFGKANLKGMTNPHM